MSDPNSAFVNATVTFTDMDYSVVAAAPAAFTADFQAAITSVFPYVVAGAAVPTPSVASRRLLAASGVYVNFTAAIGAAALRRGAAAPYTCSLPQALQAGALIPSTDTVRPHGRGAQSRRDQRLPRISPLRSLLP